MEGHKIKLNNDIKQIIHRFTFQYHNQQHNNEYRNRMLIFNNILIKFDGIRFGWRDITYRNTYTYFKFDNNIYNIKNHNTYMLPANY